MSKFYTAKSDRVFKTIMLDEDDKDFLKMFLERLLDKKIESIELLQSELPVTLPEERRKTVDALIKIEGRYVHIELNSSKPEYLHNRNFIYFTTVFNKKTKVGEEYDLVTEYIHIDLTYGMKKDKEDYREYYICDRSGKKYVENIKIIEYNMDRITSYWKSKDREKIKRYSYLIMLDLDKDNLRELSERR